MMLAILGCSDTDFDAGRELTRLRIVLSHALVCARPRCD